MGRVPASTKVKSHLNNFPFTLIEPATVLEEADKWDKSVERAFFAKRPRIALTQILPTHWLSLVAVVFLLGLKHGLDPDHLAAIDGLTRFNAARRPRLARWSGLLFSAGHGVVVTLVAIDGGHRGHRLARPALARGRRNLDLDRLPHAAGRRQLSPW